MATSTEQDNWQIRSAGRESAVSLDRSSPWLDTMLVATPLIAILFNWWLGSLTPVLVIAGAGAFILLRFERVLQVLLSAWPLLLLPTLCLLSVLWSQQPGTTLYYGILYLITVVASILIGAGSHSTAALKGIFAAFGLYTFCSVLFGRWVQWNDGALAFAGLAGSKNAAGDTAALTILIATTMLIWALSQRKWPWALASLAIMPFGLFCLIYSRATGVLIASIIALPCLLTWIYSRRTDQQTRVFMFGFALVIVLVAGASSPIWVPPLFDFILEETGKNTGLTGRTLLWRNADSFISRSPWLGTGYNAFWVHGNLDAEYLWREMGISSRKGFNFHNTPRDILVDLGYVGLALFASVAFISAARLALRTMLVPTYFGIFCCTVVVFQAPRFNFELIGFSNMHFATVIVFMTLAQAYRPANLHMPQR